MRNLELSRYDNRTVATADGRVMELIGVTIVELMSTVISRENMRRNTLARNVCLIDGKDENMQRINALRVVAAVYPYGVYIRTAVEITLMIYYPFEVFALTNGLTPGARSRRNRHFLQTDTQTIDTVATGSRRVRVFVLAVDGDCMTTPGDRLTRTDGRRVVLVERNTFDQLGRYDRVTVVLHRLERINQNR